MTRDFGRFLRKCLFSHRFYSNVSFCAKMFVIEKFSAQIYARKEQTRAAAEKISCVPENLKFRKMSSKYTQRAFSSSPSAICELLKVGDKD